MLVNAAPGYPFQSASGALNTYLAQYLQRHDYSVSVIPVQSSYVPLNVLGVLSKITTLGSVDLAVYCDLTHWIEAIKVIPAKRTLVFFHGLVGTPLVWLTTRLDSLCCNSGWTVGVLRSIGGYPLWDTSTLACPDIFQRSFQIRCPVPALGYPNGAIIGEALSDEMFDTLAGDASICGLDSFWEADDYVHCNIIVALNWVAREYADRRVYRLLVQPGKLEAVQRWLEAGSSDQHQALRTKLETIGLRLSDVFYPLPATRLMQSDLFRLMKICRFALMFNKIPESFGLMPLECVLNDCPVHTNGSGNIRYLLPPSHGITVHDALPDQDVSQWSTEVARSIYERSLMASAGVTRRAECSRGRVYIHETYSVDAFEQDMGRALCLDSTPAGPTLHDLVLAKGPLVRRWDPGNTAIVCDTGTVRLTSSQSQKAAGLLGSTAAELFSSSSADQDLLSSLWRKGLLTWTPAP
jgi:hypothetical protein